MRWFLGRARRHRCTERKRNFKRAPAASVAPRRLASRRLITHAITTQFAFRICHNAGKSRPACRMCTFRAVRHVSYAFRSLNAISETIFISYAPRAI